MYVWIKPQEITMRHALMLLASLAFVTPAVAQDRETVSTTVSMNDLNLTSREGQRAAALRVKQAAVALCGSLADVRDLAQANEIKRCQAEAMRTGTAATARAIAAAGAAPQVALR